MKLSIHTYSNKGGKQNNEDCLAYYFDNRKGIFILADGLGGHRNGEVASKIVVESLMTDMKKEETINYASIQRAFLNANNLLLEKQKEPSFANMKTTAVLLNLSKDQAIWGHLGDSRLYYFSDNELSTVTKDHSVTYKKYLAGEISYSDINLDDDRSSLLGVLGNKDKCNPEIINVPRHIKKGDAFLICSDGFWEYVFDEEILIDLLKSKNPKQWAELMLLRHIKRTKPSNDNYSLITIFVD